MKWMNDEKRLNGEILGNTSRQRMGSSETEGFKKRGEGLGEMGRGFMECEPQELKAETVLRGEEQSRAPCTIELSNRMRNET